MKNEMNLLSVDEQQEISGGSWECFGSGFLIAGGIMTLQPEIVAAGLFAASVTC